MAKEKVTCENSSGSRLRDNVSKIFDCFLIVNRPAGSDSEPSADYKYPPNFDDAEIIQQSLLFCFPFDPDPETLTSFKDRADHFTFILTDIEGKHRFGFCKLANEGLKCYCILSFVPWFEIFYKILNYTHELSSKSDVETMETMLLELTQQSVPEAKQTIQISATLAFQTPDPNDPPSIPENRNLSEYYTAVDAGFMMEIFASLTFERRIVFTSNRLSVLTSSIHSAEALLSPLHWQHIYIPVMPPHLLEYCLAPMPYLVGVHKSLMGKVRDMISMDDDIIVADIDSGEIESTHDDLQRIPNDKISFLKSLLRKSDVGMGTNLAMSFMRTQARLIGGYRNGLKFRREEAISFDEATFIDYHKSNTAKEFARELVQLQTFKQFVDGRLEMLNAGVGFRDSFENEVNMVDSARENDRDTYKEWLSAAKKGGNKFITQFQRKAKDNMKVAQQSFRNYLKQPQGKQPTQASRKKSLDEAAQRIRPSRPARPPSVVHEVATESHARKYTSISLSDYESALGSGDDDTGKTSRERERTLSNATYAGVDMDLMTDMQLVMEEKITNLTTPASEAEPTQRKFLLDLSDPVQTASSEDSPPEPNHKKIEKRQSSEIRRQKRVHSRPHLLKTSVGRQAYSSDEQSPERILDVDSTSRQLIDLTVTCETEQTPFKVTSVQSSATNDLIGLNFGSTSCKQPIDSSQTWASWDKVESKPDPGLLQKPTNPFVQTPSSGEKPTAAQTVSTKFLQVQANPTRNDSPNRAPHKLSPEKLNPFKVNTATVVPNYGNFTQTNKTVTIGTLYLPGAKPDQPSLNHLQQNNQTPLFRSMSGQPFVAKNPFTQPHTGTKSTNPFVTSEANSGVLKTLNIPEQLGNGGVTRGGSLRHTPSTNRDSELFSDLLNSWKAKEGL